NVPSNFQSSEQQFDRQEPGAHRL
nr:nuclear protein P32, muscle-specific - chicken (fragments) [Gallus gallus]